MKIVNKNTASMALSCSDPNKICHAKITGHIGPEYLLLRLPLLKAPSLIFLRK